MENLDLKAELEKTLSRTLNDTAFKIAKIEMPRIMEKVFDRPTPYIKRSVVVRKDENPFSLTIKIADNVFSAKVPPYRILQAEVYGGIRDAKSFEVKLRSKGLLNNNMYAMPGKFARLDQYGNQSPGEIIQIMSKLQLFNEVGYLANETLRSKLRKRLNEKKNFELFVVKPGDKAKLAPGIYKRLKTGVRQLVKFISTPHYPIRFRFHQDTEKLFYEIFPKEFENKFEYYFKDYL